MKTLFIGNSYTFYNDMPAIFADICREHGVDMTTDSITLGGYTLSSYLDPTDKGGAKLFRILEAKKKYDFVVLQEQSYRPASAPERFIAAAKTICDAFRTTGATLAFYETWGRRDGNDTLAEFGWTHEEMQNKLREAYEQAANENGAVIVYAGEKLHEAYRGEAGDSVYSPDGSHPSELGSRIVAQAFYDTLILGK